MPPVGGGAAFRPKNKLDQLDDDLPILDDATRKMIMQDIQRGKMPSFPKASGTGVQGASYLLQEKQQQNQTNPSSATSSSINKERDAEEIEALLRQIRSQKMGAQTNSNNNNLNLRRINPDPTTKSTGTSSSQQPQQLQRKLIVHNRPLGNRNDDEDDEENIPEIQQQQPLPPSNKRPNSGRVLRNHLSFLNKDQTDSSSNKQNNNENPPSFTSLSSDSNANNINNDLLEVMTSRLRFLEKQNGFLQSELKEKSIKLSQSQNKLSNAEEAVAKLQSERVVLAKKIVSMSKFLADYGLSWVGDDNDDEDCPDNNNAKTPEKTGKAVFDLYGGNVNSNKIMNSKNNNDNKISTDQASGITQGLTIEEEIEKARQQMKKLLHEKEVQDYGGKVVPSINNKQEKNKSSNINNNNNSSSHFDFDKFVQNCAVLSSQVSQHYFAGGSNDPSAGGKRGGNGNGNNNNTIVSIRPREMVTVVVFADGITVAGGPFRPFGWALCDAFVQDVMDGYFPYEYRGKYPDGFPIDVVDKRRERYLVLPGDDLENNLEDDSSMENSSASTNNNSPNKQKQQQRQNNNNNNNIRTLNDSPYSLRKPNNNNQGRIPLGQTSNNNHHQNNNHYNSLNKNKKVNDKKAKSAFGGRGNQLGGIRHAGMSAGNHATRELILKRIPTRYITASGRIINPAAGIAEFLNLPTTTTSLNNNNNNPQTPPSFSLMKNYKGPMPAILSSKEEVEEFEKLQKEKQDATNKKLLFDEQHENNNKKRLIRVVFPSSHGLSVEVVVNEDATVQQLHDAVVAAISNSPNLSFAIRPPIDLNDINNHRELHGRDLAEMYEMEFIVRGGGGGGDQSNKSNDNNNLGMMGARSNTSTSLMSRECSLDEAGFNIKKRNETVIVRWRKKQEHDGSL